jgi:hypothetical protein
MAVMTKPMATIKHAQAFKSCVSGYQAALAKPVVVSDASRRTPTHFSFGVLVRFELKPNQTTQSLLLPAMLEACFFPLLF